MIDLHSHLLPGIDDGPGSMEQSIAMARGAEADGIKTVVATPHVDHAHRVVPARIPTVALEVRSALQAAKVDISLLTGGELSITRLSELTEPELRTVALGRSSWVLLECPLRRAGARALEAAVFELRVRGYSPLLAHPERSPDLLSDVKRVRALVAGGCLCSITAGALLGQFGTTSRRFALQLLDEGLAHNVASDGHDADRRPLALAQAMKMLSSRGPTGDALARWLVEDVPRALLEDRPVPDRPEGREGGRSGGFRRLLGRRSG